MTKASEIRSRLPWPTSTTSYWRAHPLPLDDYQSTPDLPDVVDVAIIGGGMSGTCTAYHILKDNPNPPSVVILEARQACLGATGRNGGHSKCSSVTMANLSKNRGLQVAAEWAAFHRATQDGLKACAERENIDCELYVTRSFDVFLDQDQADDMEAKLQTLIEEGVSWMKDIQFLKGPHVERLTGVRGAKAATSVRATSFWPYKFVVSLLQRCIEMGLNLQTHTAVTKLSRDPESGLTGLGTPRGEVRAKKVVFATNAYVSALLSRYKDVIVPGRGTACHITAKSPDDMPVLTNTYNIHHSPSSVEYLTPAQVAVSSWEAGRFSIARIKNSGLILWMTVRSSYFEMAQE